MWDYDNNNGVLPENITPGTNVHYSWICPICGDSFEFTPKDLVRYKPSGCRKCNKKIRAKKIWEARRKNNSLNQHGNKQVEQYDLNGTFIAIYESMTKAAAAVGTKPTNISAAINGRQKTCAGFVRKSVDTK